MKPRIYVSDLHPEYGLNEDFRDYLMEKAKTHAIAIIGDSMQYPNSYKRVPGLRITGNHDSERGERDMLVERVSGTDPNSALRVLVHGHQGDRDSDLIPNAIENPLYAWFKYKFFGSDLRLGSRRWTVPCRKDSMNLGPGDEYDRIKRMLVAVQWGLHLRNISPTQTTTVITGHHHRQYQIPITINYDWAEDQYWVVNCGAGYLGDHLEQNELGNLYFISFR